MVALREVELHTGGEGVERKWERGRSFEHHSPLQLVYPSKYLASPS